MKKYERLEIEVTQDTQRPASPDFDDSAFRCDAWPVSGLHVWHGEEPSGEVPDGTVPDGTVPDGLSDAGLEMCLNALGRWQGEHPDQKVMLCQDGEYRVVPLDTAECFEQISEIHDDVDLIAKREFLKGAEKAIQEGKMVEDWDGTWRELPEYLVKAYQDAGLQMGDPRDVDMNAGRVMDGGEREVCCV